MDNELYRDIGRRIRQARESLRMSQEELAHHLNYSSPATISYYEGGERKVSIADLRRISATLGLPLSYFLEEDLTPQSHIFQLRAQEVRPAARKPLIDFLMFAANNGSKAPTVPTGVADLRPGKAAERILEFTEIDQPPVVPRRVADRLNVPVYDWLFPDEISGIFVSYNDVVCIGVNEHHPYVRQRFTIAHELGHLVFGSGRELFVDFLEADMVARDEDKTRRSLETKANQFAADLLMPREWIRKDVRHYDFDVTLLAKRYEVSEQALWFRLLTLKLVNQSESEVL